MSIQIHSRLLFGMAALALLTGGCRQTAATGDAASTTSTVAPTAAPASATPADPTSPCRLLTDTDVRRVFPDAKAGVPERSREQYGIRACVWDTGSGQFALQQWTAKPGAVDNEIRGLASGFVDPLNPASANNVRFETIPGVGEQAMAVVEIRDAQRGILTDVAMLVTQRGDRLLQLQSSDLPRSERTTALEALTTLGRTAVARL